MSEMINQCLVETYKHVLSVRKNMDIFIHDLLKRSEHHDDSKFVEPELSGFAAVTDKLKTLEYGSEAYKEQLKELKPILDHHYSRNRHHPQWHLNGIDDMNLVDLIELVSDWRSAADRNKSGNLRKSIGINAEKYDITPQLKRILENTVRDYFSE